MRGIFRNGPPGKAGTTTLRFRCWTFEEGAAVLRPHNGVATPTDGPRVDLPLRVGPLTPNVQPVRLPRCYLLFDYGALCRFKCPKHAVLHSKFEVLREI